MGSILKDLVAKAAAGDKAAVRELVEATQARLFKFCLVLTGDKSRAEDLSQDAYLKALESLSSLKEHGAFIDWLFRVTKNLYIDQMRRRREQSATPESLNEIAAESPELAEVIAVHRVLSQFEPQDRFLLVLVDMEDYSYKDASASLGISEDAVRSRLFRLRKEFVEKFKKGETK